ncbi:MAG: hypothetical protein NTU88_00575 [Armatimonadetes bacterium]|nr:hypothetical protein [Armatimonadota bacterium]
MLTAVNNKTKKVQEVMATDLGELLGAERAAQVAFVDVGSPIPATGACRCLGIVLFADETSSASLRIMDGGRSVPIMEAFANIGWWGSIVIPRGVASIGNLVAILTGNGAYGYVYYVLE